MTKRKPKLHPIERPYPPIPYYLHDHIIFQIAPTRNGPPQTFTGTITCLPDVSPFECYHVEDSKGESWFILESEITGKVEEAA